MSTSTKILQLLKNSVDEELSSSTICEELGISRNAVWKHVKALRIQGYVIEAHSRCGYRLIQSPDRPDAAEVNPLLKTEFIGRCLEYKEKTVSTNIDAAGGADAGCPDGKVFCAGQQTGGRGRMKREWFSPSGTNLYFSSVLRPDVPVDRASSLPLAVGVALVTALDRLVPGLNPRLKWPNDILVNRKKICGILCEMQAEIDCRVRHIIAGVGVNVNLQKPEMPAELREIATSLRIECGRDFSRIELLAALLNEFEEVYLLWRKNGFEPLIQRMECFDALKGRRVQIQQGNDLISGFAQGVQADGALILETGKEFVPVYSGETKVIDW